MFSDFQEIHNTREAGLPRQVGCDIGERDLEQPGHNDVAGRQRISPANLHPRALPESNAARYLTGSDTVAQRRKELHVRVESAAERRGQWSIVWRA
jgi:hypothetical protein